MTLRVGYLGIAPECRSVIIGFGMMRHPALYRVAREEHQVWEGTRYAGVTRSSCGPPTQEDCYGFREIS
jgi:hypothetical protein